MNRFILAAHGRLGEAFLESAEMIAGKQDRETVFAVPFLPDDSLDCLTCRLRAIIEKYPQDQFYILCDLKGGSPFNASFLLSRKFSRVHVIAGLNLAMLLEVLLQRETIQGIEDITKIVENSKTLMYVI
ncbi:PTS mannose transporter subunit IID [Clostridiaceae bacterium DONG20-135]|uniref:PTS mannose transporter subunit IID n=1 Tax=Copranaerobaculum intestinale TaxID=2692629 RepID=A0A6N8U534_9FIRM|nr:PTS sugar transporter subunit IIA [Copranaerobaculum intestinale]MXQ73308.1 PTS mannose transporter subunit IID [Copranaerobaculum intestinale]